MSVPPLEPRKSVFERELLPASIRGWRNHWYRLIYHHDTPAERNLDLLLIVAILISVAVVMVDSVTSIKNHWHGGLLIAEGLFILVLTIEYGLRLWTVRRPLRYAISFFGVIDPMALSVAAMALISRSLRGTSVERALHIETDHAL